MRIAKRVCYSLRKHLLRGPVAQLGARFHGMEEVVGSNPTRSTKLPDARNGSTSFPLPGRHTIFSRRYILTDYVLRALKQAVYDKLEDDTFAARIPGCPGVVAFAPTLRSCERELRQSPPSNALTA